MLLIPFLTKPYSDSILSLPSVVLSAQVVFSSFPLTELLPILQVRNYLSECPKPCRQPVPPFLEPYRNGHCEMREHKNVNCLPVYLSTSPCLTWLYCASVAMYVIASKPTSLRASVWMGICSTICDSLSFCLTDTFFMKREKTLCESFWDVFKVLPFFLLYMWEYIACM